MSKKKINPRRQPATMADVMRAKAQAVDMAVATCWALIFNVLRDKFAFDNEQLAGAWQHVQDLADELAEGRVSFADLTTVLREEAGIKLTK